MLQLINVSQVRNNISQILDDLAARQQPVVIIRDSQPAALLYPYEKAREAEEARERVWQTNFEQAVAASRQAFNQWLAKKNVKPEKLNDEKVYRLIKNA